MCTTTLTDLPLSLQASLGTCPGSLLVTTPNALPEPLHLALLPSGPSGATMQQRLRCPIGPHTLGDSECLWIKGLWKAGSVWRCARVLWWLFGCASWFGALLCQNVTFHNKKGCFLFCLRENSGQSKSIPGQPCGRSQ